MSDRLNEIRARVTARRHPDTPTPWEFRQLDEFPGNKFIVSRDSGRVVAEVHWGGFADCELIAHAPEDIAYLLARVAALEAALRPFADAGAGAWREIPDSQATVFIAGCPVQLSDLRGACLVMHGKPLWAGRTSGTESPTP